MNNNLPKFIPVNEVERLAGVSYNTLRYYTKIGLLPHMIRKTPFPGAPNTIGHYPEEVLETLQKINELKKQGLDNEKIKKTLEKPVLEERPMSKPVEKPVEPVLPPPVPAPILPPTPPPPPVNLVPLMAEEHKQSNLLEQISHFLTNMIQKPLPAAEPARAKVFTNLLTLFLVFAALAILSLGFSDLAHERIKRLFGGFWDQYLERILPGNVLGIKQILNPIVDVNDVLEYRYIKGTRWLAAKLPFLADTGRFLGKVFFGKGDNYFISPLGDAYLRNIYAQNITASSITSKTSSFDTAEITNLNVQNLTVSGTTVGGGGGGGGPAQGGDADTLEGQTGSYYLDLDNEIGTCSNCLTTTEIDESTLIVFNAENASTLDGLDSSQFLRSDTSDNYTSGTLTFDPGTTLDLQGIVLNSAGTLTLSDNVSVTGDLGVLGDLTVSGATFSDGDVFLGDTAADTITFIGVVSSDILPSASNTWDLGSTALRWGTGYFDNVDANSISGSLAASGTNSASWTINQDNLTANGETAALAFETGTGVFNAVLQWNASGDPGRFAGYDDQFVFNYPISLFSQVSGPNVSFSSGSLINYGQSATHAYTQTGALTGVDLDFSSNITVPDSSSGNQTGILVTLKDGGGSATSIGLQTAGTLDYGLEIGGTIGTADIRLSNGALLTNTAGTLTVAEDLLRVGTGSPNAIDSLGGDLYVTSDLEVDGVIYGNGGGLTNITADFASDSNLLDGFDSSQFLRSDTNDNFESGTLTTDAGTTLDINGNLAWGGATITEALDMATNIITDIGNAGTDFDTGGGLTLAGDLTVTGGEVFLTPIASSGSTTEGTIYYDSDNDKLYVYSNGAFRALTTGLSAYSATDAALANQNYLEILHNEATNDLAITAWYFDTNLNQWRTIENYSKSVDLDLFSEFNPDFTKKKKVETVQLQYNENNLGNGADGAATFNTGAVININTSTGIGRSCADAVNYSVTAITATTATLEQNPSGTCLAAGDEVLIINLRGTNSAFVNVGNYETLRISSISTNVVTFVTTKTKFYGDGASDDTNIGLATGNQAVMLQRVPNYTSVTVSTANTALTPSEWVQPTGSADANTETSATGAGEGGIMFFRATGTVSVEVSTTINADGKGYIGGEGVVRTAASREGGDGGEAFCGAGGIGTTAAGGNGAGGGGAGESGNGGNGFCGGGGAAGAVGSGGTGSSNQGGSGGGSSLGGAGGAGYGTAGGGGIKRATGADGAGGGINSSGNGGGSQDGGGGGGGTYGSASLVTLLMGTGGGGGGAYGTVTSGNGGDGGGVVYIAANSLTVSGGIQANAGATGAYTGCGASEYAGGAGGGAGGAIKLIGNTLSLGTSLVTASGGASGDGCNGGASGTNDGGSGGVGRIAVYNSVSVSGTTSPAYDSNNLEFFDHTVYVGEEINTPGSTSYGNISWTENLPAGTEIQFQTRSGNTSDSTDGSWEEWRPAANDINCSASNCVLLESADTETNWTGTNATVADGDVNRHVNYFEDEEEESAGNLTKITSTAANGYAEATPAGSPVSLASYDYLTFWVRSSVAGNTVKFGFGESAATEQEHTVTIDQADTWQKIYWDISEITGTARDGVTVLRLTVTQNSVTVYLDNVRGERHLTIPAGSPITSTAANYIQYRAILSTTDLLQTPTLSDIQINYTNPDGTFTIDADRVRTIEDVDIYTSLRLRVVENDLDDIKSNRTEKAFTSISQLGDFDPGSGADGSITVPSDTSINSTSLISGRSCADGGDGVNYSVTTLSANTATLESAPSVGCLSTGDEIILINLRGTYASVSNVGNWETLRIANVVSNVVTFTTTKSKYYGDNASDDTNIGLANGNQTVLLQRVPNYTDVTVTGSGTDFYPDEWMSPTGLINNGDGEGGVMFFRASGTVSVGPGATINSSGRGYIGGLGKTQNTTSRLGGDGGEAFCGTGGTGGTSSSVGGDGAGGGGGGQGSTFGHGGDGFCGGGGGAGDGSTLGGTGSVNYGGAGGSSALGGAGGGGYGTAGEGGKARNTGTDGTGGGTNSSGNGGDGGAGGDGGGGGGGTYGDAALSKLMFGASGAGGGAYGSVTSGNGGDGGGIIYIAADSITVSGSIQGDAGTTGTFANCTTGEYAGGAGGGAGGAIKLIGNSLNLGSSLVTANGGSAGDGCHNGSTGGSSINDGGAGGSGRIANHYVVSSSGSTSPASQPASVTNYPYTLFISDEIATPNAIGFAPLSWLADLDSYGMVQIQTRTGKSNNSTDGTWEEWKVTETQPVAIDTSASTSGVTSPLTLSSFTVANNPNRLLVCGTAVRGAVSVSSITWNGGAESFTKINDNQPGGDLRVEMWYLLNPTATTSSVVITFSGSQSVMGGCSSLYNVNQSNPLGMSAENNGTSGTASVNVSSTAGDLVIDVVGDQSGGSALSVGAGQTQIWEIEAANHDGGMSYEFASTTLTTMSWSDSPSDTWANIGVAVKPISASTTTLESADTHTNWTGTNMTVAEGDVTRNVDYFEDEDESLATNVTKLTSSTTGGYAEATISAADLSNFDYVTAWVRSSQSGNVTKLGFGESAATEQEETIFIDAVDSWQKVYWDITDVPFHERDAVTKLRLTNLASGSITVYLDNVTADRYLNNPAGSAITSTPNDYFQYRVILTTTNTAYRPVLHNVNFSYNTGYKVVQPDNNSVRLYNFTGDTQEVRLEAIAFGADLAEWYPTVDLSIEAGDVVSISGEKDDTKVPKIQKSQVSSDPKIMGIISTKAGLELGIAREDRRLVGLSGRVPVKVAPDSPAIAAGDLLTSSGTYPGMAQKLTKPGFAVAKALEDWNPESGIDKIDSFLAVIWADPQVLVDEEGDAAEEVPNEENIPQEETTNEEEPVTEEKVPSDELEQNDKEPNTGEEEPQIVKIIPPKIETQEGVFEKLTVTVEAVFENMKIQTVQIFTAFVERLTVKEIAVQGNLVGQATLPSGETEILIENSSIKEDSKVFLTPKVAIPSPLAVLEITEGEAFRVGILEAQEMDIQFDWWIIQTVASEE